jgi:hypothetical protein
MGERSNIFVRMRGKNYGEKTFKHETFFGLYYQWCYGERMPAFFHLIRVPGTG